MDGNSLTVEFAGRRGETDQPSSTGMDTALSTGFDIADVRRPDVRPPDVRRTFAAGWPWRGLAVALMAHGAVLAAVMWTPETDTIGGGVELEAIEVSVIDGRALEALLAASRTDGQALPATVARNAGGTAAPQMPPQPEAEPEKAPDKAVEPPLAVIVAPDNGLQVPSDPPEVDKRPADKRVADEQREPAPAVPQIEIASADGGATSRGADTASNAEPAAARAPPGVVQAYALSVAKVIARNKPPAPGPKGTARVRFTIGTDGGVAAASVLKSSGYPVLDAVALDAVRRSKFPTPPVVLTQSDTTYDLPFHFR